jgi:hypothetical protein
VDASRTVRNDCSFCQLLVISSEGEYDHAAMVQVSVV